MINIVLLVAAQYVTGCQSCVGTDRSSRSDSPQDPDHDSAISNEEDAKRSVNPAGDALDEEGCMGLVRKFRKLEPSKDARGPTEHGILEHCDGFSDAADVAIQKCLLAADSNASMRACLSPRG